MAEQESVYLWSVTAATNASADPAVNFAESQLPSTLNNSNRAVMAAIARDKKDTNGSLTTAGSANAYTLTINGRQTPLATGHRITFKASFANTGAATLAVTNADAVALGTKAIRGPGDLALNSGQMVSGGVYDARYDTAANSAAGAWILLNPSSFGASTFAPEGRVTLASVTPVMTASQAAKTTVYYTPYAGNQLPVYDGTNMIPTTFTELSQTTTDTTKSPAAVAASSVYDLFVWNDSGTIRCTRGPVWTNTTTRSAGTALVMVNGILLNNASITNGPAASRGTYVGSIASNGSSQIDYIFGAAASGGTAAFLGVWNAYNRVSTGTVVTDSGANYTYSSATVRQARASAGNQISFLLGLAEDTAQFSYTASYSLIAGTGGTRTRGGVGFDTTSAFSRPPFYARNNVTTVTAESGGSAAGQWAASIGVHTIAALESNPDGTSANTFNLGSDAALEATVRN